MVELEDNKIHTAHCRITALPAPEEVYIPLIQHIGKPASALVKAADGVSLGEKIADADAAVSSPIHASVSGKVAQIRNWPHPGSGMVRAIVIKNDGRDAQAAPCFRQPDEVNRLTPEEIRDIVRQAGIVGMGGAGFPTHIKLNPPKPVDTLILNAAECEPYLTGDYRRMIENTGEILKGVEVIVRCLGIKKVYIAIENNKPVAIRVFNEEINSMPLLGKFSKGQGGLRCEVISLKHTYPQGGEKQLIKNILKKEVPSGKLPFQIGVLVQNVATVFAIYEAVYKNKALYERVVTVSGDCLANPKNILVRLGTPIKQLIEFCSPLEKNPAKIIIGGPMMGIAQFSPMVPVIKTTSAVILLSNEQLEAFREDVCIRCAECVRNCPVYLQPCLISLAVERRNWELAKTYSPMDCIECGLCAYLCPAKRNLVQSIKLAKQEALK